MYDESEQLLSLFVPLVQQLVEVVNVLRGYERRQKLKNVSFQVFLLPPNIGGIRSHDP
jgi:hypothetical protein